MITTEILDQSIIVSAHPDDEILWFSSIIDQVDKILLCFSDCDSHPDWSIGRKKSLSEYPNKIISSLELSESEVFYDADWKNPVITEYGMRISRKGSSDKKYKKNYFLLRDVLKNRLSGYCNVITHNPWGEYGHPEHVQVYRAIKELKKEMKFNLWYSNYCSNVSFDMMLRYISGFNNEYITIKTNKKYYREIENLYKKNGCWTWYDDWEWFNEESFMKDRNIDESVKVYGHFFPLNIIKVKISDQPDKNNQSTGLQIFNLFRNRIKV